MIQKLGVVVRDESLASRGAYVEALLRRIAKIDARIRPEPTCLEFPEAAKRMGITELKLKRLVAKRRIHATKPNRFFPAMITLAEIQRFRTVPGQRPPRRARS